MSCRQAGQRDRRRLGDSGFTLVELMVSLVIIAILGLLAVVKNHKQNSQIAAAGLAREIYSLCQQARYTAMSSSKQVMVTLNPQNPVATFQSAQILGNQPLLPSQFGPVDSVVTAHDNAQVVYVASGVYPGGPPAGLLGGASAVLTFYPNGTLQLTGGTTTGATIYISDELAQNPQRVLLYGRTGFAKVLSQ